jgi:hypothetical protein
MIAQVHIPPLLKNNVTSVGIASGPSISKKEYVCFNELKGACLSTNLFCILLIGLQNELARH